MTSPVFTAPAAEPATTSTSPQQHSLPCPVWKDWARIVVRSPTIRVLLLTGASVACALTGGTPLLITAGVIAVIALSILIKDKNRIGFEWTSLFQRAAKAPDQRFNEIKIGENSTKIFLGGMPNKLAKDGDQLKANGIGAVLSVVEPWEHEQIGYSCPYSDQEYEQAGIIRYKIDHKDHTPLTVDKMDQAADFIDQQIREGIKVYVHCRAGVGRSAMAVAAYLIKYKGMRVEEAMKTITTSRPISTIRKKQSALQGFYKDWEQRYPQLVIAHSRWKEVLRPGSYSSLAASSS
jgi:protein-tyrosine phosphatase